MNNAGLIGGVVGAIAALIIIIIVVVCVCRKKKQGMLGKSHDNGVRAGCSVPVVSSHWSTPLTIYKTRRRIGRIESNPTMRLVGVFLPLDVDLVIGLNDSVLNDKINLPILSELTLL